MQDMCGTDPTQETYARSFRSPGSHPARWPLQPCRLRWAGVHLPWKAQVVDRDLTRQMCEPSPLVFTPGRLVLFSLAGGQACNEVEVGFGRREGLRWGGAGCRRGAEPCFILFL